MSDRTFRAVRTGKDTVLATGAVHAGGVVTLEVLGRDCAAGSMTEAIERLGQLSSTGVTIIWDP